MSSIGLPSCGLPSRRVRMVAWWRRHWGVRARSTLAATCVVAVALVLAAGVLVLLVQRSLLSGVESAVSARVDEIAATIPPAGLGPPGDEARRALEAAVAGTVRASVVQVLAPDGTVVAASEDIVGEAPLTPARPAAGAQVTEDRRLPVDEDDIFRVVSTAVSTEEGTYTVTAGQSLGPVEDSTRTITSLLGLGYPFLLVVVGAATYWFVGRSLRPVEAIRVKVAGIGGRQLTERVPVPDGQDEVTRLAVTMNQMLDRLESAQRSQRRFVADASHELRSPIATLRAAAEIAIAQGRRGDPDTSAVAEGTLLETQRLERLVDDLLLLARADERGLNPDRVEVDLDDLLVAEAVRVRASTGLRVVTRISARRVLGDRHQLAQVLRNLVDNAVRHADSQVVLSLFRDGADAVLDIADDGPGIPAADRDRVFDRFVRLDDSRERARGGSGLGLAIAREIVLAHGGTVVVADSASGARLVCVLPLS